MQIPHSYGLRCDLSSKEFLGKDKKKTATDFFFNIQNILKSRI